MINFNIMKAAIFSIITLLLSGCLDSSYLKVIGRKTEYVSPERRLPRDNYRYVDHALIEADKEKELPKVYTEDTAQFNDIFDDRKDVYPQRLNDYEELNDKIDSGKIVDSEYRYMYVDDQEATPSSSNLEDKLGKNFDSNSYNFDTDTSPKVEVVVPSKEVKPSNPITSSPKKDKKALVKVEPKKEVKKKEVHANSENRDPNKVAPVHSNKLEGKGVTSLNKKPSPAVHESKKVLEKSVMTKTVSKPVSQGNPAIKPVQNQKATSNIDNSQSKQNLSNSGNNSFSVEEDDEDIQIIEGNRVYR